MTLYFNGTEITELYFNGTQITELYFNGTEIPLSPPEILALSRLDFDGAISDTGSAELSWSGDAAITTTRKKSGTHSLVADAGVLHTTLVLPTEYTISFWVWVSSSFVSPGTWGAAFTTTRENGCFIVGDGSLTFYVNNSYIGGVSTNLNNWVFVEITFNGTVTKCYANGTQVGSVTDRMSESADNTIVIGGYQTDTNAFARAHSPYIDAFEIMPVALSESGYQPE